MPILATNWPPTPHPLTGQIRYVPFNRGNMPTVPYMMNVGSSLLMQLISRQLTLSGIASEIQPAVVGDSVSQINVVFTPIPPTVASTTVMVSEQRRAKLLDKTLEREKLSPPEMELTVPYVDFTQQDMPFIEFMILLNPPVRVTMVYAGCTTLLSERNHQMCLVKLANLFKLYETEIFAVDKVTGEMYTVIDGKVSRINLQAYLEEEMEDIQGAIRFAHTNTSSPRDVENA